MRGVGSRWLADPLDPQTFRMKKGADIKCCTAILSSEPLTPIREEWMPIAPNSIVLCGRTRGESRLAGRNQMKIGGDRWKSVRSDDRHPDVRLAMWARGRFERPHGH